jgi:hypothetical protein
LYQHALVKDEDRWLKIVWNYMCNPAGRGEGGRCLKQEQEGGVDVTYEDKGWSKMCPPYMKLRSARNYGQYTKKKML